MKASIVPLAVLCGSLFVVIGSASAAVCREYGCGRYANPNGWCAFHQAEGKAYRARKAAEAAADRRTLREHAALESLHDAEDALVKSNELARLKKIEHRRRKELKVERRKFAQPLEGLFGRTFGEPAPAGDVGFAPAEPFRGFIGYGICSDGTNGVVRIYAHADFTDEKAALVERDAVLAALGEQYGRTPYKIFTKNGEDVRALGFGGADGLVRQQLQVSVGKAEETWRIDLVAFVVRNPQRALVSESEQLSR